MTTLWIDQSEMTKTYFEGVGDNVYNTTMMATIIAQQ